MEGRFNGGFFALPVWGAYIGAYTWRGLFSEFYGIFQHSKRNFVSPRGHVISSIYYTSTLYPISVFSLAKRLRLILEISKS